MNRWVERHVWNSEERSGLGVRSEDSSVTNDLKTLHSDCCVCEVNIKLECRRRDQD